MWNHQLPLGLYSPEINWPTNPDFMTPNHISHDYSYVAVSRRIKRNQSVRDGIEEFTAQLRENMDLFGLSSENSGPIVDKLSDLTQGYVGECSSLGMNDFTIRLYTTSQRNRGDSQWHFDQQQQFSR